MTSISRTRQRGGQSFPYQTGSIDTWMGGTLKTSVPVMQTRYIPQEITVDETHSDYPNEGGPLDVRKVGVAFYPYKGWSGSDYLYQGGSTGRRYVGEYCISPVWSPLPASGMSACLNMGAEGWSKFRPAKPIVSLSVAIAELRDAPSLVLRKMKKFRDYGSNYLAIEFGWKPFVSDLRKWWSSIEKTDQYIASLVRKNGKRIRRGGVIGTPTTTSTKQFLSGSYFTPTLDTTLVQPFQKVTTTKSTTWFRGAFRYYIPGLDSEKWGRAKAYRQMWDLEVGPEQLYELMPWSWLIDWFSNLGHVVGNYTASLEDNVVADYAYIMQHNVTEIHQSQRFAVKHYDGRSWVNHPAYTSAITTIETKCRGAANPYGFNFSWPSLTWRQKSILSALGISRLRF